MNYRHIYHAGSFADIMKHCILIALILKLKEKDKSFSVLDAFAGIGLYDLLSEEASKTLESDNGIQLLFNSIESLSIKSKSLAYYIDLIKFLNPSQNDNIIPPAKLALYAGSPYIISKLLGKDDNLVACELHPKDYALLKYNFKKHENCSIHHIDAYSAIKAFLPPKHPRGLVLLDPAFEVKDEFDKLSEALKLIRKRYSAGTVMIWYPIKDQKLKQRFYESLTSTNYSEFLKIEFAVDSSEITMNQCGVLIANPPHIKNEIEELMNFLCDVIYKGNAKTTVELYQVHR